MTTHRRSAVTKWPNRLPPERSTRASTAARDAETLTSFGDDGFDTVIFWPVDPTPSQVERLASEVVPML